MADDKRPSAVFLVRTPPPEQLMQINGCLKAQSYKRPCKGGRENEQPFEID
jgi:hypothetical protein